METLPDVMSHSLVLSEQRSNGAGGLDSRPAADLRDQEQDEDFFDCQETLEGDGVRVMEERVVELKTEPQDKDVDAERNERLEDSEKEGANQDGGLRGTDTEGNDSLVDRDKGGANQDGGLSGTDTERNDSLVDRDKGGANQDGGLRGTDTEGNDSLVDKKKGGAGPDGGTGAEQKREGEKHDEVWAECQAEEEDGNEDPDLELKEKVLPEFDEEYLTELEKDLTQEEKESRKEESLRLKETGNGHFKRGEYPEAEESYTAALRACPVCYSKERSILFSNRAAARLHLANSDDAIADCSKAIELNPSYVRAILRRAELYEKTDKLDEALEDYKLVVEKDPGVQQAREACMRLPQQIQEKNEKLKEEMLEKLKDLGNMFLRPFGLSTSNFQVNQDPNSGSYSVNFVQNPNNNNR